MKFYSTNKQSSKVSFKKAIIEGQAPDKGLYMPERIPRISSSFLTELKNNTFRALSRKILSKFIGKEIPEYDLKEIIKSSLNFPVPVQSFEKNRYICYLDKGPTCSFKDFGARSLANFLEYFLSKDNKDLIILVATSGDTGGAVASAFFKRNRIKVVILYPFNEISTLQRKQMTTLGHNIAAIGINGKFDDCQSMIKKALNDPDLKDICLSTANSINVGRLLPQMTYYFWSYLKIFPKNPEDVIFSVPSGNFGNLMGGLLAQKMGLPINRFIAAVNNNNEFPQYLKTGVYKKINPSKNCISSAMNVGHPSNLSRVVDLYGGMMDGKGNIKKNPDLDAIRSDIMSYSINDELTKKTVRDFYEKYNKIIDPHGAVALAAYNKYIKKITKSKDQIAIIYETADPGKFSLEIQEILAFQPKLPKQLKSLKNKEELPNPQIIQDYEDFRNYLKTIAT